MTDSLLPDEVPDLAPTGFLGIVHSLDHPPVIPAMFLDDADEGEIEKTAEIPEVSETGNDAPPWLADAMQHLTNPNP